MLLSGREINKTKQKRKGFEGFRNFLVTCRTLKGTLCNTRISSCFPSLNKINPQQIKTCLHQTKKKNSLLNEAGCKSVESLLGYRDGPTLPEGRIEWHMDTTEPSGTCKVTGTTFYCFVASHPHIFIVPLSCLESCCVL